MGAGSRSGSAAIATLNHVERIADGSAAYNIDNPRANTPRNHIDIHRKQSMKKSLLDYTEAQFIQFLKEIRAANKSASDEVLGELLEQFRLLTEHPDGTDLIYYPEAGADNSNEGITETVKKWREANGLPSFKSHF